MKLLIRIAIIALVLYVVYDVGTSALEYIDVKIQAVIDQFFNKLRI